MSYGKFSGEMGDSTVPEISSKNEKGEYLEKPPPNVGTWISARFGLAYLAFFGFVNVYALRVNLSVAILSMVNTSYFEPVSHANHTYDTCPKSPNQSNHTDGEFNWNGQERSLVLGAFFYGYILTQIPGGYLASRYGGKLLLGGGILWTAVLTLIMPIAARTSFSLLIAVRVIEGIGEGVTFPAMHAMWGTWAPPIDRSRLVSLTYAGSHFGTVLAQPISGLLCSSNIMGGWPSVFYIFGIVAIFWCALWFLLATNHPHEFKWISEAELDYIQRTVKTPKTPPPVPWKEIFCSKHVWAISIAHFCNNWGFYTLLTCLPLFLKDVLQFDITQDGFVSALPYLVMWIFVNISGVVADKLREKRILNTTQTRKTFNTISLLLQCNVCCQYTIRSCSDRPCAYVEQRNCYFKHKCELCIYRKKSTSAVCIPAYQNPLQAYLGIAYATLIGPAVFLVVTGFVGCNKVVAISCICVATALSGFGFSGFNSNHVDIAPRYAGILMGITNTWGTIPGFVSPAVVGILTGTTPSRENWRIVFYIAAGIYVVGAIFYILLATGVEQDWNRQEQKKEERARLLSDDDSLADEYKEC